jgi:hypothetical protein
VAGAAADEFVNLTITGHNNLEPRGTLDGNKNPSRVKRSGFRTMEITGTQLYENDTRHDKMESGTNEAIIVTIEGGECASGYNNSLKIDMPQVHWTEVTPAIAGPGVVEESLTGDVQYHAGSGGMVEITAVNSLERYS